MIDQVLNQLVALVVGLVLGFYFERRAGRKTREQNRELNAELEALRASVYTMGGSDKPKESDLSLPADKLMNEVTEYAKTIQDAEGHVRKSLLVEHFTSNGHLPGSVNQALNLAQESGIVTMDKVWVNIR